VHRDKLLDKLNNYHPQAATEIEARLRMISFIQDHQNCFHRHLTVGHITGSAWLLSCDNRRVLLTHHRKLNKWLQLGGHADGDADVLAVALREAREESGIENIRVVTEDIFDLDIHNIPLHGKEPSHWHYDVRFLLRVQGDAPYIVSEESHALAWLTAKQLYDLDTDASVRRMAAKWDTIFSDDKPRNIPRPKCS